MSSDLDFGFSVVFFLGSRVWVLREFEVFPQRFVDQPSFSEMASLGHP